MTNFVTTKTIKII
uniref:Uncharacterized protein n=1 Tax=Lepeophtheirus salmonis TaxID=72036 RepID=A0A0K2V0Q3_LEPSM